MADKLIIEIFKDKNAEDFTKALSEPDSRMQGGSGAAYTGAISAAFFLRACRAAEENDDNREEIEYLRRNSEILRAYMIHLIDEDVRCRGPLRRAVKTEDPQQIEAALQTSVQIDSEILNMMYNALELMNRARKVLDEKGRQTLAQAATLAMAAADVSITEMKSICSGSIEPDFVFVTNRANEMMREQCQKLAESIIPA